ncbi:MAG: hypothetical protein WAL63_00705 [Solirubrobacteraceae bacterium]
MGSPDEPDRAASGAETEQAEPAAAPGEPLVAPSRFGRVFALSRGLVRLVYRDPEHVPERLTLYAAARLAEPSREWAQTTRTSRPDTPPAQIAEELRTQTARISRIDGAIAGTPFFVALVPGYLTYLLEEMRMTQRTAALYGRDPSDLRTSAEMLALRGVHPSVDAAEAALKRVRGQAIPDRPTQRRSLRTWVHSVFLVLVFGGFMSPSADEGNKPSRVRAVFGVAIATAIWLTTWILPVSFMIAMAWGCETHARQLGRRTQLYYDHDAVSLLEAAKAADQQQDRGHDKRAIIRTVGLVLSVAIPIAFIAYVDHVRNTVGFNWLGALGALVALSLVFATAVISTRR